MPELLAPAGNWQALEAAVDAGADAVYLGGRRFNMRLHRADMNFDDGELSRAVEFAHSRGVKIYVTINNLISEDELAPLADFLLYLKETGPDALIVQDFAVMALAKRLGTGIPLHASVMMNTHSVPFALFLKEHGVTRVVAGREMTLGELADLRERAGVETEYFIHGDMCVAESGQCIHSGVLFGQSSNRGRCLKPCRWPWHLADEEKGEEIETRGPYLLAMKDMCMYRHIPELVRAKVDSLKIEGRMRPPEFISRIVSVYRRAIDACLADPDGYTVNEDDWHGLYENRARDFSTCCALSMPGSETIGYGGEREPRFFSRAMPEAGMDAAQPAEGGAGRERGARPRLSVRAADFGSAKAAIDSGAEAVYVAGEVYRPRGPWSLDDIRRIVEYARGRGALVAAMTPRTVTDDGTRALESFLAAMEEVRPDAVIAGNPGALLLAREITTLPLQADFSFNIFNHAALAQLAKSRVVMATASMEASFAQARALAENSPVPVEAVIHGAYESMILDHDIAAMAVPDRSDAPARCALVDGAGGRHPLRRDQYERSHILFAKDLCLYPYLPRMTSFASWRIEGQDYDAALVEGLTRFYRRVIDALWEGGAMPPLDAIAGMGPRELGIGAYRYRESK